ncbi:unnamed protein product [Lota lota]
MSLVSLCLLSDPSYAAQPLRPTTSESQGGLSPAHPSEMCHHHATGDTGTRELQMAPSPAVAQVGHEERRGGGGGGGFQ